MDKPKHTPTQTWDCPECGECHWIKPGDPVPACETCGTALVRRPEGEPAPWPRRLLDEQP